MSTFLPTRADRGSYAEPVALVERADLLEILQRLHDEALAGSGRLALVHGEAGVGEVGAGARVGRRRVSRARVLWERATRCPRRARSARSSTSRRTSTPRSAELLRSGERDGLFEATLAALDRSGPTVLVIEDLHWADMSTLDLVRFLARRLEGTHVLVVATYRDEHLPPARPAARDARRHRLPARSSAGSPSRCSAARGGG